MKNTIAVMSLLLISSTVFAANAGKTVTCSTSVSGGNLRGQTDLDSKSVDLKVENEEIQSGSLILQITPAKKQKVELSLYTGATGEELDLSTTIKGTEVKVYGNKAAVQLDLRDKFLSSISCEVQ